MGAPGFGHQVTLAMIAERAGVHVSTVSRALRASEAGKQSSSIQNILSIAQEMGYRRNPIATALRSQRTHWIGVLVPRLTDYVLSRVYEGVDQGASARGFTSFVSNTQDRSDLRMRRVEEFLDRRVEGIVLGDARLGGDPVVKRLNASRIPFVLASRRLRGALSVSTDDLRGGELVGNHLATLGHTNVGIIAGETFASTGVERSRGCVKALRSSGINVPPSLILNSRFDAEGGREAAEELLRREPGLSAIFAVNDTAAIGAMAALMSAGRRVGQDVAVVGYNDIPISAQLPIPLTTVTSKMFQMGQDAASLLIDVIEGRASGSRRLEPSLVVRDSTVPGN